MVRDPATYRSERRNNWHSSWSGAPTTDQTPRRAKLPIHELCAIFLGLASLVFENTIAVGVCISLVGLLGIWGIFTHADYSLWRKGVGVSVVISICLGLFGYLKHQNDEKDLAKSEGVLEPAGDLIKNKRCSPESNDSIAVHLGPHIFHFKTFPQTILTIADRDVLRLDKAKGRISISTLQLFDQSRNHAIATIDDAIKTNSFWVAPNVRKHRPDKSTLVVFENAEEVLRIRYINEKAISITGVFRFAGRPPLILKPNFFQMGGVSGTGGACSPGIAFKKAVFSIQ